jgi:hypothetical protein
VADVVGQSAFSKLERAFALRDELRPLGWPAVRAA